MARELPPEDLGRTRAFLSYDSLGEVNAVDPERQFKYARGGFYVPSATFENRALILGIGPSSNAICEELLEEGYIGLVGIKVINPRRGVNQIRGRPLVRA